MYIIDTLTKVSSIKRNISIQGTLTKWNVDYIGFIAVNAFIFVVYRKFRKSIAVGKRK